MKTTFLFKLHFLAILFLFVASLLSAQNTFQGEGAGDSNTTGSWNSGFGYRALNANTTGTSNTAVGGDALYHNTSGNLNTAVGLDALRSNTAGIGNTAIGGDALRLNIADFNTAVGISALQENVQGVNNTALGSYALSNSVSGDENTALGANAMLFNETGNENTAAGYSALSNNDDGDANTATGAYALDANTAGSYNTASGTNALLHNIDGNYNTANGVAALQANTTGDYNTVSGCFALTSNTSSNNTAHGYAALRENTTGTRNTAHGMNALRAKVTGNNNTALGYSTGSENDIYSSCTFIGYDADQTPAGISNFSNSTVLGNTTRMTASNQVRIGNSSVTSIGGNAGWVIVSDKRFKKNVREDVPGLNFILKLHPVTYNLDVDGLARHLGEDDSKEGQPDSLTLKSRKEKSAILYTGFLAQDVEKTAKSISYDFSGVDKPQNEQSLYGLRYAEFVPSLVKSVQEQQQLIEEKDKTIAELEARVSKLEAMMEQVLNGSSTTTAASQTAMLNASRLEQNQPNPFSSETIIRYFIPEIANEAELLITNLNGQRIQVFPIESNGEGQIVFETSALSPGTYFYSLLIDGRIIATKQMILSRQ